MIASTSSQPTAGSATARRFARPEVGWRRRPTDSGSVVPTPHAFRPPRRRAARLTPVDFASGTWETDVILADGGSAHLRPVRPDDAPALQTALRVAFRRVAVPPVLLPGNPGPCWDDRSSSRDRRAPLRPGRRERRRDRRSRGLLPHSRRRRRGSLHRARRPARSGSRHAPPRPPRRGRHRARHPLLRRAGPGAEPTNAQCVQRCRVRGDMVTSRDGVIEVTLDLARNRALARRARRA